MVKITCFHILAGATMGTKILPEQSELGKKAEYDPHYNPDKLFPIPRQLNRDKIGVSDSLPFFGCDIWNHYEVSWLNEHGKPIVAIAQIIYDCKSEFIIESKSMKLYFNSFNNTKIKNVSTLEFTIKNDLENRLHATVDVKIILMREFGEEKLLSGFVGLCIDDLNVNCSVYQIDQSFLQTEETIVNEILYSDLLKSNCLVTNQPDWGSVQIKYQGGKINHRGLLKYIVSFRDCNEFSETAIERIFVDIIKYCQPISLSVYGRFTRRGGIDINVIRSTSPVSTKDVNFRLCRQ